jgi:heterodisulfide reductase subunit A
VSALTYPCDTLLLAVGLESVNELHHAARRFGLDVHVAGDAEEIAEASAAMFSGRLTGREIARSQGRNVEIPAQWKEMIGTLKSKPGREALPIVVREDAETFPVLWCAESIPCNPCAEACPQSSIRMADGDLLSRAEFSGFCRSCGKCVAACPGLAITLVDLRGKEEGKALVTVPYEFLVGFKTGDKVEAVGQKGEPICEATVTKITEKGARAPCSNACPAGVHAQGYIELIRKRRYREAAELLRSDLPLPSVCGRVCYEPCATKCERGEIDEPVAILGLKRFVSDWALQHDEDPDTEPLPSTHEEKVAVIGSGPSGLACANEILRRGYRVTVFEAAEKAGGMLRYGIPAYRLPD